jgi:hypothetical protein
MKNWNLKGRRDGRQVLIYIDVGSLMDFRGRCEGDAERRENGNAFSGGKLGWLGRGVKIRK